MSTCAHGEARRGKLSPEYRTWCKIRQRCDNPNDPDYPNYGARGIKVCGLWSSYAAFLEDMGRRPPGYSIERLDVNKDYEPANCVWIPHARQALNRRKFRNGGTSKYRGVSKSGSRWIAQVNEAGRRRFLGRFASEEEAARARDAAVLRIYGDAVPLNFPNEAADKLAGLWRDGGSGCSVS